jgi:hypothetical protein
MEIKIPRIYKHFKTFIEFKVYAEKYFAFRCSLEEYDPKEMRIAVGCTPNQLGMITNTYNKTKGNINKCLILAQDRFLKKEFDIKNENVPKIPVEMEELEDMNYKKYLRSAYWKNHRKIVISRNNKCALCNKKVAHIHHRSYKNRGTSKELKDLIGLCEFCHEEFHKTHIYDSKQHAFLLKIL